MKLFEHSKLLKRYFILLGIFICGMVILVSRLIELQIVKKDFLTQQGDVRVIRTQEIPAIRGMILDRNGEPLAVSTPVQSLWIEPKVFATNHPKLTELAAILDTTVEQLQDKQQHFLDKEFAYIARHVNPDIATAVSALAIPGVHTKAEYKRFYPSAEVSSQVVGVTNIDDIGQEGLELSFNDWLQGRTGKRKIIKDNQGRNIEFIDEIEQQIPGQNVTLSLDQRLQYLSYRILRQAVLEHRAESASAVVLNVHTGEVLAMVNQPTFDPNSRVISKDHCWRNLSVTDAFEPASAIKTFSLASVLENNHRVTPATLIDTSPGILNVPGGTIRDISNNGMISVNNILRYSSNIAVSKLVLDMPADNLIDTYERLGFGWSTGSGFPGENVGNLNAPGNHQSFVLATMAFGYGLTVTPLQLAKAYATLGSKGAKRPVTFLRQTERVMATRVMSPQIAQQVIHMLSAVVSSNHSNAKVDGYHVAGKTGTARKVGRDGYERGRHRAVFGGLAPAINSKFAIVVTINEPNAGQYYSNSVAAPVFSKIAASALRLYGVSPDLIETQGMVVAQNGVNHS